jgi:two-component sensor histidine kinase
MGRTLHGCRKDGALIPVEIGLTPLHTPAGPFVLASVIDISARRKAELEREGLLAELRRLNGELEARVAARTAHLSAALREREVLLREVHHRVKNNLYVVSSLLAMQGRRLTPGAGRAALEQCQTRVLAIALIHEKLYESRDLSNVSFSEYVRGLAAEIFHAGGTSP